MGTWVRHTANGADGAVTGATIDTALVTSAADNVREKVPVDGVESSLADAAEQLSACACVWGLSEPEPGAVDPCIGQSPLPEQQATRASGESCHPAHSAH